MKKIIEEALKKSFSYEAYKNEIYSLLNEGKSTGHTQSDSLLHYSELNTVRIKRLDKTIEVNQDTKNRLNQLEKKYLWLVISEGWCGDAAQIVPVINKMAEASEKIELKIALRDENEELMNLFLTNGSKSIPKLIIIDTETLDVIADWGPRPEPARKLIADYKELHGKVDDPIKTELQKWYLNDKGNTIQKEIMSLTLQEVNI